MAVLAMMARFAWAGEHDGFRVEGRSAPVMARPGQWVPVAVRFVMAPGWHTYAEHPGDSGMPADLTLVSPNDGRLDVWRFPPAMTFRDAAGTTYGYEREVVLRGAVMLPHAVPDDHVKEIVLDVSWLVCKDLCVAREDRVAISLFRRSGSDQDRLQWWRFLKAGGWSDPDENHPSGTAVPGKENP